jgi:4-carboxymuconolactone decarboxylase
VPLKSRISVVDEQNLTPAQLRVFQEIQAGPRGGVRGPFKLLLHSPILAQQIQQLGEIIRWKTQLDRRLVELAILLVAQDLKSNYVWQFHVVICNRDALLSPDIIRAIEEGRAPDAMDDEEAAVYYFTRELLKERTVSCITLNRAIDKFAEKGVIELTSIIGYYHIGALLANVAELSEDDECGQVSI